ncbi:MAG TPA: tyrosine-type recombinase/integrase [Candidatus Babeliaceae bacterium]|nr:tyrosine-type recombinase/integrase [Candidatus Babeliaceae bacterium]
MKKNSSFDDLVSRASDYLGKTGRSASSIDHYRWTWGQIKEFMGQSMCKSLSQGATAFIKEKFGGKEPGELSHHHKTCMRYALCLVQFEKTGTMPAHLEFVKREEAILSGEIGTRMTEFVAYKQSMRLNPKTLASYKYYLYLLNKYLNQNKIFQVSRISPLILLHYISILLPGESGARHLALGIMRSFFQYLFQRNITANDLSIAIPRDNYKKQPRLPSSYSKEEVTAILKTADRSTCIGKRNYAILFLAVRLGLRASDIRHLQFKNVNWSQSLLSFNQQKTGARLELPIPTDVGESIVDYLQYGRPSAAECNYIFVEHIYPYNQLSDKAIPTIANTAIQKSRVKIGNRKHGSHSLRHTLANFLLEQEISLPIISQILGHESIQSSMCYLRINIKQLRQCSLEVPGVPVKFYNQKGGAFYEA